MAKRSALMAVVLSLVLAFGLAVGMPASAKTGTGFNGTIKIFRLAYFPNVATVEPGALVRFQNLDGKNGVPHSATSDDGLFDTGLFFASSRTITAPMTPGEYWYHCIEHPFMHGLLIVKAPVAPPPTPVPTEPAFTG